MKVRTFIEISKFIVIGLSVLMTAFAGCSSDHVTGSQSDSSDIADGLCVLRIVVVTDVNSPQPATPIEFELPENMPIFLEVTNATGYHITTLMDGITQEGRWEITWDGTNDDGEQVQTGIYMYHLEWPEGNIWGPMRYVQQ